MVVEIVKTAKMAAVIVPDSRIVVFMWYDNDDGDNPDMHVRNMQYFDATDNICQLLTQLYRVCRVSEANRTRVRTNVRPTAP